jgi:hypothetical protein
LALLDNYIYSYTLDQINNGRSGGEQLANDIQLLASKDAHSLHKSYWSAVIYLCKSGFPSNSEYYLYVTFYVSNRAARSLPGSTSQNSHLLDFFSRPNTASALYVKAEASTSLDRRTSQTRNAGNRKCDLFSLLILSIKNYSKVTAIFFTHEQLHCRITHQR